VDWDDDEPLDPEIEEAEEVVGEVVELPTPSAPTLHLSGELIRRGGPRAVLRAAVEESAEELAQVVVGAATGKGSPERARLALSAIDKVDPAQRVSMRGRITTDEIERMSLRELEELAEAVGIA